MNTLRNKVNLVGRVGAKPEILKLATGNQLTRVSIATHEPFKDKAGEWVENTQWHNIVAWGKSAERIATLFEKGIEVLVQGRLVNKTYETKTGEKRYSTEIELSDFLVLTPKQKAEK